MNLNQQILDKILLHYIGIERLKAGAIKRFLPLLRKIDDRLLGAYSRSYGGNNREFIKLVKSLKTLAYVNFEKELAEELKELAVKESAFMTALFAGYFTDSLIDSPKNIEKLFNAEIRGLTLSQWVNQLKNADINKYITVAKTAVNDGLTLNESIKTLEALHIRRDNSSKTLIRTLIAGFANQADDQVFKANPGIIKGVKLSVTFDNRTTPICIKHSEEDILYPVGKCPIPGFHPNCRTVMYAVTYSWKELGAKNQGKVPVSVRQSMDGGTPNTNTYGAWLKTQPKSIQNDVLGKTYGKLFRAGKYPITRFIDPTGKYYTIQELFG